MPPDICPNCGAEVPPEARVCPECGSDEQTGWSDEARLGELGLPDPEPFDYEGFVAREFGPKRAARPGVHWIWWIAAVALVLALGFWWLR